MRHRCLDSSDGAETKQTWNEVGCAVLACAMSPAQSLLLTIMTGCCSKEDKLLFAALLKPCLDISMWKGYEADNHNKNAQYYEGWYQRLVSAGATILDVLNKYQVRQRVPVCA